MPHCPLCKTQTDLIKYEGVPIYNCGTCGGHWLDRAKLQTIVVRREIQMPEPVKRKMIEIADASNSTRELWCLACGKAMVKEQFKHWPEIQIDRCPKCNGIWLDRGELEKCQIYWEYIQDNPESEEAQRAVRMAQLDARWQTRQARLRDQVDKAVDTGRFSARAGAVNLGFLAQLFGVGRNLDPYDDP